MSDFTLEQAWSASPELRNVPTAETTTMLDGAARLVVVSPHPDDEMLSAAGLMAAALDRGMALAVISVTDGEASHPGSNVWTADRLGPARAAELDEALLAIGGHPHAITRLHFPDSEVAAWGDRLTERLLGLLDTNDLVICPWRRDGHPDHEAVAHSVIAAKRRLGFRLLEAPIWMWHWQTPDAIDIPWAELRRVRLSRRAVYCKARSLAAFRSQITVDPSLANSPIVSDAMLAHFRRPFETFFYNVA